MPTYTVHAPPSRKGDAAPERFRFVRDGFHGWAFIAPALWLIVYRQWIALIVYVAVTSAIVAGLVRLGAGTGYVIGAGLCISLLIGFEAATIRRWTLARRRWSTLGFVVGNDRDEAERRFFAAWAARPQPTSQEPLQPLPAATRREALLQPSPAAPRREAPHVIGLFPKPGATR